MFNYLRSKDTPIHLSLYYMLLTEWQRVWTQLDLFSFFQILFIFFLNKKENLYMERSICSNQARNNVNSFCSKKIIHFKMIYSLMLKLYIISSRIYKHNICFGFMYYNTGNVCVVCSEHVTMSNINYLTIAIVTNR